MSQERLIELINMELDGETTPQESAELARALIDNPAGQRLQSELSQVVQLLKQSADAQVPSQLRSRVLDAIPRDLYEPDGHSDLRQVTDLRGKAHASRSQTRNSGSIWAIGSWLRYATVFGLGIVSGLMVFTAVSRTGIDQSPFDPSRLSGTMGGVESSGDYQQLGSLEVSLDAVQGSVRLYESNGAVLAQVSLRSAAEIEWVLHYGGSGIALADVGIPPRSDLAVRNEEITVRQASEATYLFRFDQVGPRTAPPSFRILVGDQLAFEGVVSHSVEE